MFCVVRRHLCCYGYNSRWCCYIVHCKGERVKVYKNSTRCKIMNLIAYINREEKKRLRLFEVCALKTKCIMKILVNKHERSNIFEVDGCFLLIFLNRNTLEWWKKNGNGISKREATLALITFSWISYRCEKKVYRINSIKGLAQHLNLVQTPVQVSVKLDLDTGLINMIMTR